MKISTDSWHYRLIGFFFKSRSESLCTYFWQVAIAGIMAVSGVVFIGLVAFALAGAVLMMGFALFVLPFTAEATIDYIFSALLWVLAGEGLRQVAVVWAKSHKTHWLATPIFAPSYEVKEDNLMVEYLKAKKEKICPQIEFYYKEEV